MIEHNELKNLVRERLRLSKKQEIEVYETMLEGVRINKSDDLFSDKKFKGFIIGRYVIVIRPAKEPFHIKIEFPVDCFNTGLFLPVEQENSYSEYTVFDIVGVTSTDDIEVPLTLEEELERYCDGGVMVIPPSHASLWKRLKFVFDNRSKELIAEVIGEELVIFHSKLQHKDDLAFVLK